MNFKMLIEVFTCVILILGTTHAGTLSKVLQDGMERGLTLASRDDIATGRNDVLTNLLLLLDQISRRKGVCENGWIGYGDSCYYFSLKEELLSWADALLECRAKGGYLAEIDDQQENNFIETQAQFIGSSATNIGCRDSFLTGNNKIPDSALSASSSWGSVTLPYHGRLNALAIHGEHAGAWSSNTKDKSPWIQADLQRLVKVTGVVTQGRQNVDQWVKTFVVYYSSDCSHWTPIKRPNSSEKIFTGNTDRNTKITNIFPEHVTARCIRLNPRQWHSNYISMRFDVLGCTLESAELSPWLGGTDILHENDFLWATSGTRISYDTFNDWHPRQPDNAYNNEHCLMMTPLSGWHDAACSKLNRYVCEKDNN